MTLIACANCDTVIVQVPMGIDPDSIDLSKYNCKSCGGIKMTDIKEVYYCGDCAEFKDLAVFKDKYTCPSCGVYDEVTREV